MKIILTTLLASLFLNAQAADFVRFCQDDVDVYPWHMASGQGLSNTMLKRVSQQLGVAIQTESMPWKRCLLMVQKGQMDAAIAASFTTERLGYGAYPLTRQNQPDSSRRMSGETYALFVLKNGKQNIKWDGKTLYSPDQPVAAQLGYSVVEYLRKLGTQVDDSDKQPDQLLRKLLLKQVSAAVLLSNQGRSLLNDPRFGDQIIQLEPPVLSREGFLFFSHAFIKNRPGLAELFWDEIAKVRESAEYQKQMLQMLNQKPG